MHWMCSVLLQNPLFHAVFTPTCVLMIHAEDARRNQHRSSRELFCYLCPTWTKTAMWTSYNKVPNYQILLKRVPGPLRYFTCTRRRTGKPISNRYFAEPRTRLTPYRNFTFCANVVGVFSASSCRNKWKALRRKYNSQYETVCTPLPASKHYFLLIWIKVDQLDDTCFIMSIYCSTCFRC